MLTSIAGDGALVDAARAESALADRKRRPLFFIDIGVPRNVDPQVNELDDVYLYDVDDLQQVSDRNAEERRRDPREDLLTGLVQARHEGSRLSEDEMLSMLGLILIAGNETTTNLIGNSVVTLLEHPDQLAKLREKPDLMSSAVEEVLRFSSPVQFDPRRSSRSQVVRDRKIEEGAFLLCWLGSANRDEAFFERPDVFDITRPRMGHLAFGFGVHHCLGANLARLEPEVAIGALLERTRHIERVDDEPLPLHPSPVFRGVTKLPLRLTPA